MACAVCLQDFIGLDWPPSKERAWLLSPAAEYPVIWNKFELISSGLQQNFIQIQAQDSQRKKERGFGDSEGLSWCPGITHSCQVVFHLTDYREIISTACAQQLHFFPKLRELKGGQREYHCKKTTTLITLNQDWQGNSGKEKLVSFCVSP